MVEELAAFGFARVLARPGQPATTWVVIAVDEGPYSNDTMGHRTIDAVGREAAMPARQCDGYPEGGNRCDPSMLGNSLGDAVIERTNPGTRPQVPAVVIAPRPPAAALASTPDVVVADVADMSGLDDIDWAQLSHAHGTADDVPAGPGHACQRRVSAEVHSADVWESAMDNGGPNTSSARTAIRFGGAARPRWGVPCESSSSKRPISREQR